MVKVHKVDDETIILELEPTKYYHLWNIGDLYEHLYTGTKKMTFEVEDFPIHIDKLKEYAEQLKSKSYE
jgi:hypothetical protein